MKIKLFQSGEDRYLNNLLSNNAFILQHFMKLYFYADSKELINQIWTKQYWKEELYDLFEPKTKNGKRLFDCLSTGKKARFREVLNPNKNDWKELTRIFVKEFEENVRDKVHTLPPIPEEKINKNKEKIFDLFQIFCEAIFETLHYTTGIFRMKGFFKLIDVIVKDGKTDDLETIMGKTRDINFSDRYLFLQEYYFTHEKM